MSNSMGRHSPSGNSCLDRGAAGKALRFAIMTSRAGNIGSRLMSGARRSARHHSTMTVGGSLLDPERFAGTSTACCPAIGRAGYAFSYISLPSVKRNHPLATR